MKQKWIVISLSVLFFLSALTIYANRVLFPTVVKKIAIEQAEAFLKRKVEIESLRFNWLHGVVIDHVKVYQKDSSQEVFFQAEKISIAMIFLPGLKQHKLILSSVNIDSPSAYLIHQKNDIWNFSDLLTPPAASDKPSPVAVTVGGVHISNGKLRIDDIRAQGIWTELVNPIDMSIGLSYQGISFKGSLTLPQEQGFLSVDGAYQPLTQSLTTSLILKNIKPLDYLGLVPTALPITLTSGTIKEVNTHIEYTPEKINVQGRSSIKDIDLSMNDQHLKTDMDVTNADIFLNKNSTSVKGLFSLANTNMVSPAGSVSGNFKADVSEFLMHSQEDITVKASVKADAFSAHLPNGQSLSGQLDAAITQGRLQKDSASLEGTVTIDQASLVLNDEQTVKGDLKFDHIQLLKNKNATAANLALTFNKFDIHLPGQVFKGNLSTQVFAINIDSQNNITANGPLDLTDLQVQSGKNSVKGALHLKNVKTSFDQTHQTLDAALQGTLQDGIISLEQGQLTTDAHFDLHAAYPLKDPKGLTYSGTLSVADGKFDGLPFGTVDKINLTTDFKTDGAAIQNLSLVVLDTPIKASGSITNFMKPVLNVSVASERFDLSKIKDVAPDLLKPYGLTVDGETSFQVKFEGLAADPLSGEFNAVATLKDVNILSGTLKQQFKNISGTLKANGSSLSWDDFTATIMDKELTSSGKLSNFKDPKVTTSLSWNGLDLEAQINVTHAYKNIDITNVAGKYLTAAFTTNGSVDLSHKAPAFDITNTIKLKLEDLSTLAPALKTSLTPLKLSGNMDATLSLKGSGTDWKSWDITSTAESALISMSGFKFDTVKTDIAQADGKISKFNLTSKFYDGDINIVTTADLTDPAIPFQTAVHVENVNVTKLKNDSGAKDEDLRGFIALTTVVNGTIKDILNVKGKGSLNISQGYLMKKEFSSLFMIPELSNLIFTDATANFDIADQTVTTDNFALKSEGATLNGKGTIKFNHEIQMELHPEFNTEAIAQSDSMRKGPSAFIASAAGTYLTFTVTGTLEKPQVRKIAKPMELIKKTGQIIQQNVGQILQGIFQ